MSNATSPTQPASDSDAAATGPAPPPRIDLHGIAIDPITEAHCIETVFTALDHGRGGWIVTANLDHLRRLTRAPDYRQLCAGAELVVADGMPLIWASRLQRTPLPERVAGSDLISSLSAAAAQRERTVFLLGGDPGTAERAAQVMQHRFPGLKIAGTHCPPLGFEHDPDQIRDIQSRLTDARPDIVYVALGSPKQERLIVEMRNHLPAAWWIGVGISFSFLAGDVRRAPRWLQRLGLEWLHRLLQEPRRLARRYLIDGLPFLASLLATAAWRGITPRRNPTRTR